MNLLLAFAAATLLASPSQDDRLATKLDYETVAVPVARVLEQLGQKTGVDLKVNDNLGRPVLVISVKGVTLKELMDRIAQATSGDWLREENTYRLVRHAAVQNREVTEERRAKVEATRKAIAKMVEETLKPSSVTSGQAGRVSETEGFRFGAAGGAVAKAIARLAATLDPAAIAGLAPDERIVYSTAPTRMQLPFAGNVEPIFADLVREHNKELASRPDPNRPMSQEEEEILKWVRSVFGTGFEDKPVEERPAKALLVVMAGQFFGFGSGYTLELRLYGANGKVLLSGQHRIPVEEDFMSQIVEAIGGERGEQPKPTSGDHEIEFSEATRQLSRMFSPFDIAQGMTPELSKELEEKLTRPDLYDPLSFAPSDSLLSVAKHKGLNVVANLPDAAGSLFGMALGSQPQTVETFIKRLEGGPTRLERTTGWLIVRPSRPEEARKTRLDRVALAALIAAARSKGGLGLDDLAAYALKASQPMETEVATPYLSLFAPNAMGQGLSGLTDWNMLRLYGSLSPQQREALASGAAIPFSNLSPAQQEHVRKMAFGSSARLRALDPTKPPEEDPGGFLALIRSFTPQSSGDWREEPTEIMPNGLPQAGSVSLQARREIVGVPAGGGALGRMMGVVGADEIALLRYFNEDPRMGALAGGVMPRIEGLRLGTRTVMRFTFAVAPNVVFERTLNDDRVDKNAPTTPMDRLPEELRVRIEKRLEDLKKNPLPFPPFGGNPPPR